MTEEQHLHKTLFCSKDVGTWWSGWAVRSQGDTDYWIKEAKEAFQVGDIIYLFISDIYLVRMKAIKKLSSPIEIKHFLEDIS